MSNISGTCSLIIRGKELLDFDEIDEKIGVLPTVKYNKGDCFSKSFPNKIPNDLWIYNCEMDEQSGNVEETLSEFLTKIKPSKVFIKKLAKTSDICIRCFVQSELAQIGFDLSPYIINELANINIRVEVSILSWGEVEKD